MEHLSTPRKLKIEASRLRRGMYVCELDRPWLETPFLTQGFPLLNDSDISAVQKHCIYVYVDVDRSRQDSLEQVESTPQPTLAAAQQPLPAVAAPAPTPKRRGVLSRLLRRRGPRPVTQEVTVPVQRALKVSRETSELVRTVFDDVRLGKSIDTPQAKEVVSRCVEEVIENPDAMLLLTNIKDKDNYTAEHSLNVAVLSIILGKQLGLERERLEELGVCGLLHDVGKVLTPDEVLKKPGRLSAEEFLIMKMHPGQGRDILMSSRGALGMAIDVAHAHHERLDGTGYPRGLKEDQVGLYTRLVAVVDTFDAITRDRIYDAGRTNIEAFKILQSQGGNHYDSQLVSQLIGAIGVYPPGSVVHLSSGEFAVVVRTNQAQKLRPKVLVLKNARLRPVTPRFVDLATATGKDLNLRIVRTVRASEVGVDTHAFRRPEFLRDVAG